MKKLLIACIAVTVLYVGLIGYVINAKGLRNQSDVWLELANPITLYDVYLNA